MLRILQLSDAHLSPRADLFRENFARVHALAETLGPDLIMATGDLSLDGADHDVDLILAKQLHDALPAPVMLLPGNHDTGSHPKTMPRQHFDSARLKRFRAVCGVGRGLVDLPGWRIIGLNSEVMGTGHVEEAIQAAFIEQAAAEAGERRIALFLHKPVFVTHRADPTFDYWSVPPHARETLAPLLDHPGLRLVASGHLHLYRDVVEGAVRYAWAPPLSFVVDPEVQPGLPGERLCGALLHVLHADHVETQLLKPEGMEAPVLDAAGNRGYPESLLDQKVTSSSST